MVRRGLLLLSLVAALSCTNTTEATQAPVVELPEPLLPSTPFSYSDAANPLPNHFVVGPAGSALALDNSPSTNPITDPGATLGRVLFYDRRLSADNHVSCGSCHQQQFGFTDT